MTEYDLETLMLRHFDGDLTPSEYKLLDGALIETPDAPALLAGLAAQELCLAAELGHPPPRVPAFIEAAVQPARLLKRRFVLPAAAACLLLAFGIIWWLLTASPAAPVYKGTALFSLNTQGALTPATEIKDEERYFARSGLLELEPAAISFKEPTVFSLPKHTDSSSRRPVILHAGYIHVATPPGGSGVSIHTRQGTLTDIGTTFEIKTNDLMEEKAMLSRIRSGVLNTFVITTVLSGMVKWESQAGETKTITPKMGSVNLAYDPTLGKIADRDGLAYVKPVNGGRWTLAERNSRIETGDWIKTGARGANAVEVRLKDGTILILGPAGLMEIAKGNRIRLHRGELEVRPLEDTKVKVEGPGDTHKEVTSDTVLRATGDALTGLKEPPRWLTGYKTHSSTEAMGELVANIDERNLPLTLGYHKVTVDIRDQIARTVVEESFVNHTNHTLEGVFYFPLPSDASISGFAMWINGECVEADIVEKQRAREIYEQILREKRDPGLLEWTGGNIFKARVYPIFAHSEKRIRITYTQVLPKKGDTYRYTYALQSELLKQHPLRELEIKATIHSAEKLTKVECPSHMTRIRKTDHSGSVEFTAEEYTPGRDFELQVTTEPSKDNIAVIPHLRGKDGYFMVLLQSDTSGEARDLVRDGKPLEFILIADSSGSMTDAQIESRNAFIESLLLSLDKKDTFNLVCCDVSTEWVFESPTAAIPDNVEKALDFLNKRGALGWTDLDRAFGEAAARANPETHVIYIGDGIPTTGDADPATCADRIKEAYRGRGTFNAVAVGTSYEHLVMKAIATCGTGSLYKIASTRDAPHTARSLLSEITTPCLRDITISWEGFDAARLYPEVLPNLPAGMQQIILGRYLPQSDVEQGNFIITGTRDGEKVTRTAPVSFAGAEEGNSFIPRLWARMHLDYLLTQGATARIKEQIIALSEDFQIITPYTSLLVLESDADRERFKVKKRLRMRDGEEFFAKGKSEAAYELTRQQMHEALKWRQNLHRVILRSYYLRGRDLMAQHLTPPSTHYNVYNSTSIERTAGAMPSSGPMGSWSYGGIGGGSIDYLSLGKPMDAKLSLSSRASHGWYRGDSFYEDLDASGTDRDFEELNGDFYAAPPLALELSPFDMDEADKISFISNNCSSTSMAFSAGDGDLRYRRSELSSLSQRIRLPFGTNAPARPYNFVGTAITTRQPYERPVFANAFPTPGAPAGPFEGSWPKKIRTLIDSINRRTSFTGILRIAVINDGLDVRNNVTPGKRGSYLISPESWCAKVELYPGDAPMVTWSFDGRRGSCDTSRHLGSTRKAVKGDLRAFPDPFSEYFDDTEQRYSTWTPELIQNGGETVLQLTHDQNPEMVARFAIDTKRNCIVSVTRIHNNKVQWTHRFSDFTEIENTWWPQTVTFLDSDNKKTRITTISYESIKKDQLADRFQAALKPATDALMLTLPLPDVADAKERVFNKKADINDRWVLMNYFGTTQRWDEVQNHFDALTALAKNKSACAWIRLSFLYARRRNEAAREECTKMAQALKNEAPGFQTGTFALARRLYNKSNGRLQAIERMQLIEVLKPVLARQDERLFPMKDFKRWRLEQLNSLGRGDEALSLRKHLAETYPYDLGLQNGYAQALFSRGEIDQSMAYLTGAAEGDRAYTSYKRNQIRRYASLILYNHRRLTDFLAYLEKRIIPDTQHVEYYDLNRMLSALVRLDRLQEADKHIASWLKEPFTEEEHGISLKKLEAAVQHALGQGDQLYSGRIDQKWLPVLGALVREHIDNEKIARYLQRIYSHWRFKRSDEGIALRLELYKKLLTGLKTLPPYSVQWIFNSLSDYTPAEDEPPRAVLYDTLFSHWKTTTDPRMKQTLEQLIRNTPRAADMRRMQYQAAADAEKRALYARQLFSLLVKKSWKEEIRRELLSIIPQLGYGETKHAVTIRAIQIFTNYLIQTHGSFLCGQIPDRNNLDARELRDHERKARKKARQEAMQTLKTLEVPGLDPLYRPFITIEYLTLAAELSDTPADIFDALFAVFKGIPEPVEKGQDTDDAAGMDLSVHQMILSERCIRVGSYLAVKPDADPRFLDRLLELNDTLIKEKSKKIDAQLHTYQLLVVADRPDALETLLRKWVDEKGTIKGNRWLVAYGYILAEQGKLKKAVDTFEKADQNDELSSSDHRALSNLYMALDRKEKYRDSRIETYSVMNEWELQSHLSNSFRRHRRSGDTIPEEITEEELLQFSALFRKTSQPVQHIPLLQQYYRETKDFRLLQIFPDAIRGQSAAKIYDLLCNIHSLLDLIGDEATCDRIQKELAAERKQTGSTIDKRALSLLEFLVQHRAAEQAHGAGPHVKAALSALKDAFKAKRQEGEEELMARFLESAREVVPGIREELLRQLEALHEAASRGSRERFKIGISRGTSLWDNKKTSESLAVMEASIEEFRKTNGGFLPPDSVYALTKYAGYLVQNGENKKAEALWRTEIARGYNTQQRHTFTLELYRLYARLILHKLPARLGSGATLYRKVHAELLKLLEGEVNENHVRNLVDVLCSVYRNAHKTDLKEADADLKHFAFNELPELLHRFNYREGQNMVSTIAQNLYQILGVRDAIAFLITRAETEPRWLERMNADFWRRHNWRIARWRSELKDLGDLESRLLDIVREALRQALITRQFHCHTIFHKHHSYFWAAKREEFFQVAMDVLKEHSKNEESILFITAYIFDGLEKWNAAIDALKEENGAGRLSRTGQWRLVTYLQRRNRYEESLALLEGDSGLVARFPDEVNHHTALMKAYYHTQKPAKRTACYEEAVSWFKKQSAWNEHVIASLAKACLDTTLYEESVSHYDEAISLRRKALDPRGEDSRLYTYYINQADAYARLNKTAEAVDAALGSIVVWTRNQRNRTNAINNLVNILKRTKDLEEFADSFDTECAELKQEKPALRKALGRVFLEKKDYQRAVTHLEAYIENGRFDRKVYEQLIEAYDKGKRPEQATAMLLERAREEGHTFELYKKLGDRFVREGKLLQAERAFTTLAELSAHESEGHALLADVWEKQKLFEEASVQWAQVSRIRSNEPTGYLGEARCLKKAGKMDKAQKLLQTVLGRSWPERFGDVHAEARKLLK